MKNLFRINAFILLATMVFLGCKKDEFKLYYTGGTAPQLSAVNGADIVYANADQTGLTLNWTNPDYTFTTGVSSMDVSYNIEIDTVGADFTSPTKKVISVSKDLSYSFLVSDLNDIMLNQLNLEVSVPHEIEIRVVSHLVNNSAELVSNNFQLTATPYAIPPKVAPPASGQLFLVGGDALLGGWSNPVPVPTQEFTQLSPTLYELTITLSGGDNTTDKDQFLFIPVNGDWSHKYACKKTADQSETGGDFGLDLSDNFPGPTTAGTYKITVDFQKGKYTVTKQ